MANITHKDFSGGWRPSDDAINGAPNGLLKMDNLDLDTNGALSLIGGTSTVGSTYGTNLHTLYSKTLNGTRTNYGADTAGVIFRDNTSIGTGGDATIAAFGNAFNYVLACSGTKRIKDTGSGTAVPLGVGAPTSAPSVTIPSQAPTATIASLVANTVTPVGTSSVIGGLYLQITANASGNAVVQTYAGASDPHDANTLVGFGSGNTGYAQDTDTITITGYVISPWGKRLQIAVLLVAGNNAGDRVTDYYAYQIDDLASLTFDPTTGLFTVIIKRSDFSRVGNGLQTWSTTYGLRITYEGDNGDVINILGSNYLGSVEIDGGTKALNGDYQYKVVHVNNTGSYIAKSIAGPESSTINVVNHQAIITPADPTIIDAQINEVWIYRRGGLLETWYRVLVVAAGAVVATYDTLGDIEAKTLNIKLNPNLVSIASTSISEKILNIVGPIQSRWYYFTSKLMYPSDLDNPDLVDSSIAVRLTGSNNEIFLWAKQVDRATVLVGTSVDVYVLTGTFATLPDFTIDIYYHALGCKYPPITYDADVYNGDVVYLANDGWRIINANKENPSMVSPGLDLLYKGISRYSYTAPNLKVAPGSVRFPICIARDKIWCFVTGTNRCEVFDFTRKYWRTFNYGLGDVGCVTSTQDGQVLCFYPTDKKLREIDIKSSKLIDGATKQTVTVLFPTQDGGMPRNRKDSETFKTRIYTNGDSVLVGMVNDLNGGSYLGPISSTTLATDKILDMSTDVNMKLCKTYSIGYVGLVSDFVLQDWSINFEPRPEQRTFFRSLNTNFGSASKKRIRNRPFVIDTLGNSVTRVDSVDNLQVMTNSINTSNKDTEHVFFTSDVFGIDYSYTLSSTGLFEFYEDLPPLGVQTLPVARRFDQIGPEEFFKYGKIKQFEIRVMPIGGSLLPYIIYFAGNASVSGNIVMTDGVDDSYYIDTPKGTNGRITRITFGPTAFDFHRFYVRMQVAESGKDTELRWISVE